MSSWVRLWLEMPTDPKFRVIARNAGRPLSEVLSVYVLMLTSAGANASERGRTHGWCDEVAGAALDMDSAHVEAIRVAMQGRVLDGDRLTGWEKRQPKREDNSADRAREWRERKRTHPNAEKRPDSDSEKKEKRVDDEPLAVTPDKVISLVSGLGTGRGGEVSANAQRAVALDLGIADAAPLVAEFYSWRGSSGSRNADAHFRKSARTIWENAAPEVRAACRPIASEPIVEPVIPERSAAARAALAASALVKGGRR